LVAGDVFPLVSATTHVGNFASIVGNPGSGLAFTFTNGMLSVVSGIASNSTNLTFAVTGKTLGISWPADHLGWILQAQTNNATTGLGTNWVDLGGSAAVTGTNLTVDPANPAVFYRLRHP
ncbi:MAG TPA: hypothetical protein VF607_12710, partial [Verrucomicrobiae bacterium]